METTHIQFAPWKLRQIRRSKKLSLVEVGRKVGVTDVAVGQFETGKAVPSLPTFLKLCQFYGISDIGAVTEAA